MSREGWGRAVSAAIACVSLGILFWKVDLTPEVDPSFFFSKEDPQLQVEQRIAGLFPETTHIIVSARGKLEDPGYQGQVAGLTQALETVPGAISVYSLSQGPRGLEDAQQSPLWSRVLLAEQGKASNLFVFMQAPLPEGAIKGLESARDRFQAPDFQLILSGPATIAEQIKRSLGRDLQVFSIAAFLIFGATILLLFHSVWMMVGTVLATLSAGSLTLVFSRLLDVKIGLLTANVVTIVFVMTIEHILFLTFNWRYLVLHSGRQEVHSPFEAARVTWQASFWSGLTTLLGFLSLLFTHAVPLQALGISGAIGTALAFAAAYGIFLWFLPSPATLREHAGKAARRNKAASREPFFRRRRAGWAGAIAGVCLLAALGIFRLETDPSLLSYFARGSDLEEALSYVDRNLGSSPLNVVVGDTQGGKLNSSQAYRKLWGLHDALEQDPAVGSVISLPLIMAEAKRQPLVSMLPWEWLLTFMENSQFSAIARTFITEDRRQGQFVVMMKESGRGRASRQEIVERIRATLSRQGFTPDLIGGTYLLQGRLARMVTSNFLWGLAMLIALFIGMARWLSGSWRVAAGVGVALSLIPMGMLGTLGWFRVPFDVISTPAANIAISMGVDSMIHLIFFLRYHEGGKEWGWDEWERACTRLWQPIFYSAGILCAGFGIFGLSRFPPTQRFGLSIVLGAVIAPLAALFLLPAIAAEFRGRLRSAAPVPAPDRYAKRRFLLRILPGIPPAPARPAAGHGARPG